MSDSNQNQTQEPQGKKPLHISDEQAVSISKSYRLGRATTLICYSLLLIIFTGVHLFGESSNIRTWLVAIFPLVIFIPGLIKNTHRTYSWLCFIILMYFLIYVPLAMTRSHLSDWFVVGILSVFFIAAMMTSRWLQYWNYYNFTQKAK